MTKEAGCTGRPTMTKSETSNIQRPTSNIESGEKETATNPDQNAGARRHRRRKKGKLKDNRDPDKMRGENTLKTRTGKRI
jgi:hypothetical protein